MNNQFGLQRDHLIEHLCSLDSNSSDFKFITPDFGARPLDNFRESHPDLFIFTGIAEQVSADMAYGVSLAGVKPFVYGMSPFISARAYEQYKVLFGQTSQPVCILPVGVGLGYDHNTCSHYSLEDIALYSSINGMTIHTPIDCQTTVDIVKSYLSEPSKIALRLERQAMPVNISTCFETEKIVDIPSVGKLLHRDSSSLVVSWGFLGTKLATQNNFDNYSLLIVDQLNPSTFLSNLKQLSSYAFASIHVTEESYFNTGLAPYFSAYAASNGLRYTSNHVDHSISTLRAHRESLWRAFDLNNPPY